MSDVKKPAPTSPTMSPQDKAAFFKVIVFEQLCVFFAVYLIMGGVSPDVLTSMGLPVLVAGDNGLLAGIAVIMAGAFPLLRFLLERNKNSQSNQER